MNNKDYLKEIAIEFKDKLEEDIVIEAKKWKCKGTGICYF